MRAQGSRIEKYNKTLATPKRRQTIIQRVDIEAKKAKANQDISNVILDPSIYEQTE